jgi:hypothetical protein
LLTADNAAPPIVSLVDLEAAITELGDGDCFTKYAVPSFIESLNNA